MSDSAAQIPEDCCPVCTKDLESDGWCFECRTYPRMTSAATTESRREEHHDEHGYPSLQGLEAIVRERNVVDSGQEANRPGDATNAPGHDTEEVTSMPDKLYKLTERYRGERDVYVYADSKAAALEAARAGDTVDEGDPAHYDFRYVGPVEEVESSG